MEWANLRCAGVLIAVTVLPGTRLGFAQASKQPKPSTPAGTFLRLTFTESSPLNKADALLERLGKDIPARFSLSSDRSQWLPEVSKELFTAFVPPDENPSVPYGLFIWLGVGDLPAEWQDVFVRHKLIVITIGSSEGPSRMNGLGCYTLPADAVFNMKKRYRIDDRRTYVSGFSAGGQLAAMLVRLYPEIYSGGLFLMGGYFTVVTNHGNDKGPWEATVKQAEPPWRGDYEQRKREVKLVIMRGGADHAWWPQEGRSDAQALVLDGFERVTYIEVPTWPHVPPNKPWFEKGIAALEANPKKPPATQPTADLQPNPAQVAQAHRLLVTAQVELESPGRLPPEVRKRMEKQNQFDRFVDRARQKAKTYLQQTLADYPTTPAARQAKEMLDDLEAPAANRQASSQPHRRTSSQP